MTFRETYHSLRDDLWHGWQQLPLHVQALVTVGIFPGCFSLFAWSLIFALSV